MKIFSRKFFYNGNNSIKKLILKKYLIQYFNVSILIFRVISNNQVNNITRENYTQHYNVVTYLENKANY